MVKLSGETIWDCVFLNEGGLNDIFNLLNSYKTVQIPISYWVNCDSVFWGLGLFLLGCQVYIYMKNCASISLLFFWYI